MKNIQKTDVVTPFLISHKKLILIFILIEIGIFFTFFWLYNEIDNRKIFFALLVGFLIIFITLFSVERIFFIFLIYLCTLPTMVFFRDFRWLRIGYTNFMGYPLFLLLVFYWIIWLFMKKGGGEKFTSMDWAMIAFITSFLLSSFMGILNNHSKRIFARDFMPLSFFLTYFIFLNSSLKDKKIQIFFDILWVISIIICFQHLYSAYLYKRRIMSDQIHFTQISIPYIIGNLGYLDSKKRKILAFISLPITLAAIIISFQRALWITTLFLLIFLFFFLLVRKKFLLFGLLCLMFIIFWVGGRYILFKFVRREYLISLVERVVSFRYLEKDISLMARMDEINTAVSRRETFAEWLVGKGLGDTFLSKPILRVGWKLEREAVDNAYAYLLWKMGILGLITYLIVLFVFFKRCFFLLRNSKNDDEKIYSLTAILFLGTMCIITLTNATLVDCVKITFVEALIFGIIEHLRRKY